MPFWSYQLNCTAKSAHLAHFCGKWAGLAVLFSRQLQNCPQDFDFFQLPCRADYSFELNSIETYAPQFLGHNNLFLGTVYHKSALTPFLFFQHMCSVRTCMYTRLCAVLPRQAFSFVLAHPRAPHHAAPRALSRTSSPLLLPPDSALARAHCTTVLLSKRSEGRICAFTAMLRTTVNVQCSHTFEVQLNQKLKFWFKVHEIFK